MLQRPTFALVAVLSASFTGAAADPAPVVTWDKLDRALQTEDRSFKVYVKSAAGKPLRGVKPTVTAAWPSRSLALVVTNPDPGVFLVKFQSFASADDVGHDLVFHVQVAGADVKGSPFTVHYDNVDYFFRVDNSGLYVTACTMWFDSTKIVWATFPVNASKQYSVPRNASKPRLQCSAVSGKAIFDLSWDSMTEDHYVRVSGSTIKSSYEVLKPTNPYGG